MAGRTRSRRHRRKPGIEETLHLPAGWTGESGGGPCAGRGIHRRVQLFHPPTFASRASILPGELQDNRSPIKPKWHRGATVKENRGTRKGATRRIQKQLQSKNVAGWRALGVDLASSANSVSSVVIGGGSLARGFRGGKLQQGIGHQLQRDAPALLRLRV